MDQPDCAAMVCKILTCDLYPLKNMATPSKKNEAIVFAYRNQTFWFNPVGHLIMNHFQEKKAVDLGIVSSLRFVERAPIPHRNAVCVNFWCVTTDQGSYAAKPKEWMVAHPNWRDTLAVLVKYKASGKRRTSKDQEFAGMFVIVDS